MPIYNRIKEELDKRDITVREFARQIDYSFESVRRVVNDQASSYSRDLLDRTCRFLEMDVSDLIYFSYKETKDKK